jgi:beta-aspartyl-peptidase (threonine type)
MSELYVLALHAGTGTVAPEALTASGQDAIHRGLDAALRAGQAILAAGGSALDAVVAAVAVLEDDRQFNAGAGSVFNAAGRQEMDAAVIDGRTRAAGAVSGICGPRNPVAAARAVMERSRNVMMHGEGAMAFCRTAGVPFEEDEYFHTDRRWRALEARRHAARAGDLAKVEDSDRHGSVGAVALDQHGHLAAAASTGGTTGKAPGRLVGSPMIGSGLWANSGCAISATGDGDHLIRMAAAHEVCARMRLSGMTLAAAAAAVVSELGLEGGTGGMIAIDRQGEVTMPFSARGMYRGLVRGAEAPQTAIFREAPRPAIAA